MSLLTVYWFVCYNCGNNWLTRHKKYTFCPRCGSSDIKRVTEYKMPDDPSILFHIGGQIWKSEK